MTNNLQIFLNNILKIDDEMLKKINKHKILDNQDNDLVSDFVGCYTKINNNILVDYSFCVPKIMDLETLFINVHEYTHAYLLENNLYKKYNDNFNYEMFAILAERLYATINCDELYLTYLQAKSLKNHNLDNNYYEAFSNQFSLRKEYQKENSFINLYKKRSRTP